MPKALNVLPVFHQIARAIRVLPSSIGGGACVRFAGAGAGWVLLQAYEWLFAP